MLGPITKKGLPKAPELLTEGTYSRQREVSLVARSAIESAICAKQEIPLPIFYEIKRLTAALGIPDYKLPRKEYAKKIFSDYQSLITLCRVIEKRYGLKLKVVITPQKSKCEIAQELRTELVRNLPKLHIKELNLSGLRLSYIPEEIGLLDLEGLDLSQNLLTILPRSISKLTKLKVLYLRENCFRVFPEEICELASLEYLDMEKNYLKSLPESIGRLRNLKYLRLSRNKIEILPSQITSITSLATLYLAYNKLKELPDGFANTKLVWYDFGNSKLNEVYERVYQKFRAEKILSEILSGFLDIDSWSLELSQDKEEIFDANDKRIVLPRPLSDDEIYDKVFIFLTQEYWKRDLESHEITRKLYHKAMQVMPFKVVFSSGKLGCRQEKYQKLMFGETYCSYDEEQISIQHPEYYKALGLLIFELTNAIQTNLFKLVRNAFVAEVINAEEYAKECERIEFWGLHIHHKIMEIVLPDKKWPQSMDLYKAVGDSFEEYWKKIRHGDHVKFYLDQSEDFTILVQGPETKKELTNEIAKLRLVITPTLEEFIS